MTKHVERQCPGKDGRRAIPKQRTFRARSTTPWILTLLAIGAASHLQAQFSGPPTATCHVTDGQFTSCPGGPSEWSDVQPLPFPSTNSFLYVNQDAGHAFLYLMYDFPVRTTALGPTDSVHVSFDTVSQDTGVPALEEYDIYIFGNGQMQVLEQGKPIPAGRIAGAAGFGASPNSATPHVLAELQVPLLPGPPTTYSPDPLFWTVTLPPLPPLTLPPGGGGGCPTDPGKVYNQCVKAELAAAQAAAANAAAALGVAAGHCGSVAASACGPIEQTLMSLADMWAMISIELGHQLGGDPPGVDFTVPPDPNYTTIAQLSTYSLAIPTSGLTASQITAVNAFAALAQQFIAAEQADIATLAKLEGATAAGDATWIATQTQLAQIYGALTGVFAIQLPGLLSDIGTATQASGVQFTFTPTDVAAFQTAINPSSPTSDIQQQFVLAQQLLAQQLGASAADQSLILQLLLSLDPQLAGSLGVGAFPPALSDAVIATTLTQVGTGLLESVASPISLSPSFQITLPGDYVAAGVGLRGQTAGTINLSGIPAGASVVKAFLYWGMLDNGSEPSLGQLNLNGIAVSGTLIGSGPDTCWGRTNSFSFRADVTTLVSGNGAYALSGVASGGNILADGASLVVIYQLTGAPLKTVLLDDGNLSMPLGTAVGQASFTDFTASSPASAKTTFIVGDGRATQLGVQMPTSFSGSGGSISFSNLFNSLDGPFWDTDTFDVSAEVTPGVPADAASLQIAGSCLLWSAQAFSVSSAPAVPVTATAAVVQANPSGDTVTNSRGLKPSDAPTIQDQISFVVQSRTIQNPSISSTALTSQLVNGLVNDGILSPSQASSIQTAVLQKVVAPPAPQGPPALSGKLASPVVTASANAEVDLQLTNTGTGGAQNTTITQVTLRTLAGSGTITLNAPALPDSIGTIAVGVPQTVKLFLNVPSTVKKFSISEIGTMQDSSNNSLTYAGSQVVFVQ
jgi:hypothetical protein